MKTSIAISTIQGTRWLLQQQPRLPHKRIFHDKRTNCCSTASTASVPLSSPSPLPTMMHHVCRTFANNSYGNHRQKQRDLHHQQRTFILGADLLQRRPTNTTGSACTSDTITQLPPAMKYLSTTEQNHNIATSEATVTSSTDHDVKRKGLSMESYRRRRNRRSLSSTLTSTLTTTTGCTAAATATTTPVNTVSTLMKLIGRRRRRPPSKKQEANGTKLPRRILYNDPNEKWNSYFKMFQKFVQQQKKDQKSSKTKVSTTIRDMMPQDRKLRRWLVQMRCEYQKKIQGRTNHISDVRVELLRNCGFTFLLATIVVSWEGRYKQLVQFLKKYNGKYPHELKSSLSKDEMDVYYWCNRQRILRNAFVAKKQLNHTHINDERIARLDEINFVWSLNNLAWHERYNELQEYYNHHGNCMVPSRWLGNPKLAKWVETQRRQYTLLKQNMSSNLSDERIKLLEKMDFEWDPYEVRWLERYNELIEFQKLNGDLVLPNRKTGAGLFRWIEQQKKAYHQWLAGCKPSTMNEERRDRLVSRGVDWVITPRKKKRDKLSQLNQQLKRMS